MSSRDSGEKCLVYNSFLQWYQESLEKPMKHSDLMFHFVDGLHYKCHKVSG